MKTSISNFIINLVIITKINRLFLNSAGFVKQKCPLKTVQRAKNLLKLPGI